MTAIAIGLVAAIAGLCATGSADAALGSNPYVNIVQSNTYCNAATRQMTLGASIVLDPLRAPSGAWVQFNFAFYQVNALGQRTSQVYYHNGSGISTNPSEGWSRAVFLNTTKRFTNIVPGGGGLESVPAPYQGGTVNWNGRIRTEINVAVGGYVTGWLSVPSYQTWYPDSTGGHWVNLSECHLSIFA